MSGLAQILINRGFVITGSDNHESAITRHLESQGVKIHYGQCAQNIDSSIQLVVYTAAIHPDNPEFIAAQTYHIPMMDRAELLGQIMRHYAIHRRCRNSRKNNNNLLMISHILLQADCDPTISVGGILKAIHGNIRIGHSQNFITEACEYTNSFLKFNPKIEVILNIIRRSSGLFQGDRRYPPLFPVARRLPDDGVLIINGAIEHGTYITDGLPCRIVTFGLEPENDFCAQNITFNEFGFGSFDLIMYGEKITRIQLSVTGLHNVINALSAIACAIQLNISMDDIRRGLLNYEGTDRRFEYKGQFDGVTVIDDYAQDNRNSGHPHSGSQLSP